MEERDQTQNPESNLEAAVPTPAPEAAPAVEGGTEAQRTPEVPQSQPEPETAAPEAPAAPGVRTVPRSMVEIDKEYDQLANTVGKAYLQKEFHEASLRFFSQRSAELSNEKYDRQQLEEKKKIDAAKASIQKKATKVANETIKKTAEAITEAAGLPVGDPGKQ